MNLDDFKKGFVERAEAVKKANEELNRAEDALGSYMYEHTGLDPKAQPSMQTLFILVDRITEMRSKNGNN